MSTTALAAGHNVNRHAVIGELAGRVQAFLRNSALPIAVLLALEGMHLYFTGDPATSAYFLIVGGTLISLSVWTHLGIGLPIVPLLIIQQLIVYALPIVVRHDIIREYPVSLVTSAGLEVFVFDLALIGAWRVGMQIFTPGTSLSYALMGLEDREATKLLSLGFSLITVSTLHTILNYGGLLEDLYRLLPSGSISLINPLTTAASSCGFFLISIFIGKNSLSLGRTALFWLALAINILVSSAELLLSASTALFASVVIGLFWSTGRIPWRFLFVVLGFLSFFNLGKTAMRERYWALDGNTSSAASAGLTGLPNRYAEWAQASVDTVVSADRIESSALTARRANARAGKQGLAERINNLQNLLFAIDAIENTHLPLLGGRTYSLIPPLLVPRILWPDKPRTHEGQVLLNVHFGRQDLYSTIRTYIAWGLLAEAYANYGAIFGSLILGLALGFFCSWLENITANKLLLSLEGFLSFTFVVAMANSYEMVASVLVTTIFQGITIVILACAPFVERLNLQRTATPPSEPDLPAPSG